MAGTYDPKCEELARCYIEAAFEEQHGQPVTAIIGSEAVDYERRVVSLAQAIQSAIDDFLDDSF